MGAPLPPNASMPPHWAQQATLRTLPQPEGTPQIAGCDAYWIEELSAWIATKDCPIGYLRKHLGEDAKIILAEELL